MTVQTNTPGGTNTGTGGEKKKGGGCCIAVLCIVAIVAAVAIVGTVRGKIAERREEAAKYYEPGKTDLREYLENNLGDYVDEETYIIEAYYPGIEEDIENYEFAGSTEMSEEDRRSYAEYRLTHEYAEREMEKALLNMEKKVCVVGVFSGGSTGYTNGALMGYDNGFFRSLPYSTFWMKSFEGSTGSLPKKPDSESSYAYEDVGLYNFEYYPLSAGEIESMKASIDQEADAIAACIPEGADLWQKCRVIHDELVKREDYDLTYGDHCHDLYGALVNHRPVCEGYALAFQYVMEKTGERCDVVVSNWDEVSDMTHAWNKILGPTYEEYIDVTWDDPGFTDPNGNPVVQYDYFGLTEEEITAIDSHAFESNMQSYLTDPMPFNYYRHEGYLFSTFDPAAVEEAFLKQYQNGSNYLTVRFDNQEAYQAAFDWFADTNNYWSVMDYIGYSDSTWYSYNDSMHIYSIGFGEWQGE